MHVKSNRPAALPAAVMTKCRPQHQRQLVQAAWHQQSHCFGTTCTIHSHGLMTCHSL